MFSLKSASNFELTTPTIYSYDYLLNKTVMCRDTVQEIINQLLLKRAELTMKKSTSVVKRAPRKVTLKPITFVANVLDASDSMNSLKNNVLKAFNHIDQGFKVAAAREQLRTSMSLYTFGSNVQTVYENTPCEITLPLQANQYNSQGMTALFWAVKTAIVKLKQFAALSNNKKDAFLVNIYTDGHENESQYHCDVKTVIAEILELADKANWTFTFQVPRGHAASFAAKYGIPVGNIVEWEQTIEGTQVMADNSVAATASYMASRSQGATKTTNFYTDLSKVSVAKLNKKLTNVSSHFRVMAIDKEVAIKEFVETKTKKVYVIGSCYYELMKPETVQGSKAVLVMTRQGKLIYGGEEARSLVGIPVGGSVKVHPGNHADYRIFVQSTSVNRKLVRGTSLLLDKSKVTNSTPTWDHNKVTA